MNTFHKIMLIALTSLYGSAQLLACTFNFFNDTDAKILLIDAQEVVHTIAPNTQEEIIGAIDGDEIQIFELEQDSNRIRAKYSLFEQECAVDGEPITTIRFSSIKTTADNAWDSYVPSAYGVESIKAYRDVPFSIEGSTQKFSVLRIS